MQSSTGPDDVKIKASGRTIKYLVTFADTTGGVVVADSFTVDRQFKDQPISINAFQGVGAAQATIVVPHSERLSAYHGSGQSVKLKSGITVQVQIGAGTIFTRFTGLVTYLKVDAQGTATITALDYSVRGNVGNGPLQLCAAGVTGIAANSPVLDLGISPLAVVDLALRAGGIYLSPQSVWTTPTDRPKYLVLSVPGGRGGYVPEIGYIGATHPSVAQRVPGKFGPEVLMTNDIRFWLTTNFTHIAEGINTTLAIEFWFRTLAGQPCQVMQIGGLILDLPSAGVGALLTASAVGATPTSYTTTTTLSDGAWHYARVVQQTQPMSSSGAVGGVVTSIVIDSSGPALVPSAGVPTFDPTGWDGLIIFGEGGPNPIAIEGLEVAYYVGAAPPTIPVRGPGATAPDTANITLTTARLQAIPAQTAPGWWQTIQDVAAGEGAVAWFDEVGEFTYLPRLDLMANRANAPVRAFTGDDLTGLVISQTDDNVFGTVTASYRPLKAINGLTVGGTWALAGDLTVPPGTTVQQITVDPTFIVPKFIGDFSQSDPVAGGGCFYRAVATTAVGDPAATDYLAQIAARPSANGFELTIYNPQTFPITFWSKTLGGSGGPCLIVNSWGLTVGPTPKVVTIKANPNIPDTLAIADSSWRQDEEITTILATSLAADTVVSVPVFDQVTIAGDPRIQLGDIVTVLAEPIMDAPALVMIVGIVDHGEPGNAYTQDLQLRAVGPATGWILGVPGRSELPTTTLLTI